MKLSKEAISYILDLQRRKQPQVCCLTNLERLYNIKKAIMNYNGKVNFLPDIDLREGVSGDTLLILVDEIKDENILYMEKALISFNNKKGVVFLEIGGINSSINKRNLALSFLSRYNLDVIKGTKEEIETLIKGQMGKGDEFDNKDITFKYRYFSKKNHLVLIIEGDNYYITDGYSEFSIENINKDFFINDLLEDIHTGMIAVGLGVCKSKGEIIQSILVSTLSFEISELYVEKYIPKPACCYL